mgnify:CR=1 FL=1
MNRKGLLPIIVFLVVVYTLLAIASFRRCQEAEGDVLADPLVGALQGLKPKLSTKLAEKHVEWARAAVEGTEIEPDWILSIAFRESSLNPFSISRRECLIGYCVRVTGVLREPTPTMTGPFFCGVMQTKANSWKACQSLAKDTLGAYRAGALHLQEWLDNDACRLRDEEARWTCALTGYGGGPDLIVKLKGKEWRYTRNVRATRKQLQGV